MDLRQLKNRLENLSESLSNGDRRLLNARLASLASAFPFNEYEYVLMFLLDKNAIKFAKYEKLRENYVSANKYLELYEFAPRIFGEIWHQYIMDLDDRFVKPDNTLDPIYERGQYDLWIEGLRIEVKSCRAINTKKKGSLVSKALRYEDEQPFWMNYQQIKLDMADVFIFIGVWVNKILAWVMSNDEVKKCRYLSHQHRGGIECQIGIRDSNISDFDIYQVEVSEIGNAVLGKGKNR